MLCHQGQASLCSSGLRTNDSWDRAFSRGLNSAACPPAGGRDLLVLGHLNAWEPLRPEVTPLVSPGHGASHSRSIPHGASIWQVEAAPLTCLPLLHIHAPVPHAAWTLWSTRVIGSSVCDGAVPCTQAPPQDGCGGRRRHLGFLVSAAAASPWLGERE